MVNTNNQSGKSRSKRINQLALVFEELVGELGDEISSAELLLAAQKLIKHSNGEYSDKVAREYNGRSQFYGLDVAAAMEKHPHRILSFKSRSMMEFESTGVSCEAIEAFNEINSSFDKCRWEV